MAKDTDKNIYYTVGIPKNSDLLRLLQQDAQTIGMQVPKLLVLRAHDYYTLMGSLKPSGGRPVVRTTDTHTSNLEKNLDAAIEAWPDE